MVYLNLLSSEHVEFSLFLQVTYFLPLYISHYLIITTSKMSYLLFTIDSMAGLQALPLDIHIMITKLLKGRECLICSQV